MEFHICEFPEINIGWGTAFGLLSITYYLIHIGFV